MFSLNVSGFEQLTDALTKYQQTVSEGVKDALAKSVNDMADAAKANTSGALSDAISTEIADDGLSATITANSPDAVNAEYGVPVKENKTEHYTNKHKEHTPHKKDHHDTPKPRPNDSSGRAFLNPAFEANKQALIDSIAQTLQNQ